MALNIVDYPTIKAENPPPPGTSPRTDLIHIKKPVATAQNLRCGHRPELLLKLLEQFEHAVRQLHRLGEHRRCCFGHDVR